LEGVAGTQRDLCGPICGGNVGPLDSGLGEACVGRMASGSPTEDAVRKMADSRVDSDRDDFLDFHAETGGELNAIGTAGSRSSSASLKIEATCHVGADSLDRIWMQRARDARNEAGNRDFR
jgi:hypothetical protein